MAGIVRSTAHVSAIRERLKSRDEGPSEAQLAMQRRRQQQTSSTSGLDEEAQELLEQNRMERSKMEEEISELKERSIIRKREREKEEREMAERREAEEQSRRANELERKRAKEEEEQRKREERAEKMAEMNKQKCPQTPNFVIAGRKDRPAVEGGDDEEGQEDKKSPEQLEAEKRAILKQRMQAAPDTGNMDAAKLTEKARELHAQLFRLESEKYDLSRRFKGQMNDMQELAERARSQNKVGKQGNIKRIQLGEDESDTIQERFAGCPARIIMYSEYERQKDKREYGTRRDLYTGPVYGFPAERVMPQRVVMWNEEGLPLYEELGGAAPAPEEAVAE